MRPKIQVEIIRCGMAREQALHLGESQEVSRPHARLRRALSRSLAAHIWPHHNSPLQKLRGELWAQDFNEVIPGIVCLDKY